MMTPALPPSSSTTFFLPARSFIRQPTDGEPVKVRSLNRSSATIRSPSSRVIGRIETDPAGTPAASMISATASIVSGSFDGGLRTIGLPDAIAGAILWAARLSGKLNGLMPAIGPIGKRRVIPTRSFELGSRSSGMTSPVIRSASSAPRRKVRLARSTSTSASRIGLPASVAIEPAELLASLADPGADLAQDAAALVGRQHAGRPRRPRPPPRRPLRIAPRSRCRWRRPGSPATAGLSTTSMSGESTQRPARKIGCGFGGADDGHRARLLWGTLHRTTGRPGNPREGASAISKPTGLRDRLRIEAGRSVRLERLDPDATFGHDRASAELETQRHLVRLRDLQDRLWAEAGRAVLVVLQGIDAAGKDGTIHKVMEAFNPQGCPVTSFKVPSTEELAHDYLWRVHQHVPRKGEIGIFNRSHYEDVLVVRVHGLVPKRVWSTRYGQINDFERMLTRRTARPSSSSSCRSTATSSASGSRHAMTTRRSAGSSRWATSTSGSCGTTTGARSRRP